MSFTKLMKQLTVLAVAAILVSCSGDQGTQGNAGSEGQPGTPGTGGTPGNDGQAGQDAEAALRASLGHVQVSFHPAMSQGLGLYNVSMWKVSLEDGTNAIQLGTVAAPKLTFSLHEISNNPTTGEKKYSFSTVIDGTLIPVGVMIEQSKDSAGNLLDKPVFTVLRMGNDYEILKQKQNAFQNTIDEKQQERSNVRSLLAAVAASTDFVAQVEEKVAESNSNNETLGTDIVAAKENVETAKADSEANPDDNKKKAAYERATRKVANMERRLSKANEKLTEVQAELVEAQTALSTAQEAASGLSRETVSGLSKELRHLNEQKNALAIQQQSLHSLREPSNKTSVLTIEGNTITAISSVEAVETANVEGLSASLEQQQQAIGQMIADRQPLETAKVTARDTLMSAAASRDDAQIESARSAFDSAQEALKQENANISQAQRDRAKTQSALHRAVAVRSQKIEAAALQQADFDAQFTAEEEETDADEATDDAEATDEEPEGEEADGASDEEPTEEA